MPSRAVLPACAPPPFPEPPVRRAKRGNGTVATLASEEATSDKAPSLQRQVSVPGNILVIDDEQIKETINTKTYLIQRKLKDTQSGSIRIGYVLDKDSEGVHHAATASSGQLEMLDIKMESRDSIQDDTLAAQRHQAELAALHMLASHSGDLSVSHAQHAEVIASDESTIYIVTPHHRDGSLFDYCTSTGILSENDARFFFQQILAGLETLERVGLCHRGLSMENIYLHGLHATIVDFSSVLRIPWNDRNNIPHMIVAQPLVGTSSSSPQYMAPELFNQEPFDGYAVDLWSAGVMLLAMLAGSDALFFLPSPQDYRFKEICLECRLASYLQKLGLSMSAEAVDLLQKMLVADPARRLSRDEVATHSWILLPTDSPAVMTSSAYYDEESASVP